MKNVQLDDHKVHISIHYDGSGNDLFFLFSYEYGIQYDKYHYPDD